MLGILAEASDERSKSANCHCAALAPLPLLPIILYLPILIIVDACRCSSSRSISLRSKVKRGVIHDFLTTDTTAVVEVFASSQTLTISLGDGRVAHWEALYWGC